MASLTVQQALRESRAQRVIPELLGQKVIKETQGLKVRKVIQVLKAPRESEALQVMTAQTVHKAPLAQKETLVIPDRPDKAPTPQHRLVATRTHRRISTQTLQLCRDLRRHLRLYKEVDV